MKVTNFLSVLCSLVLLHNPALSQQGPAGLYFTLNNQIYQPGDTVTIYDIGVFTSIDPSDVGASLVCRTELVNTQCCRNSDGGNVGEWFFPNGTMVPRNGASPFADFSRTGSTHQVRLNHRNFALTPSGFYECRVPDGNGTLQVAKIRIAYRMETQPDHVLQRIKISESFVPDHAMIELANFGIGSAVPCIAIGECCSNHPQFSAEARLSISPSGTGSWRYPNGSYVLPAIAGDSYGIIRHSGQVNLHHQSPGTAEGVWRCEVPGTNDTNRIVHLGIYAQGRGIVVISTQIYLRVISLRPLKFALVCETTGGPATHTIWKKNGSIISSQFGRTYQQVINYEDAKYLNRIEISGDMVSGKYDFESSNAVSGPVSSTLDLSGVRLIHRGRPLVNNSVLNIEDIRSLICITDRKNNSSIVWRSPTGANDTRNFQLQFATSLLYVRRYYYYFTTGIWSCEVSDQHDNTHHIYVGLYWRGGGILTVSNECAFSLVSMIPPVFTLTCTTTGGPATTINWTRNGAVLTNGRDYAMTQVIVDTQTSTYENRLTVSGRKLGMYSIQVSNSLTPSPVLSQYYTVTEADPPIAFSLSLHSDDGILVSWTPAASADTSILYVIYYSSESDAPQQASVPPLARQYILRGLVFADTYNVSIGARSDFESRIGPKKITIGIPGAPESFRAEPDVTSIQLYWDPPSEYHGPITHYQVSYQCADNFTTSDVQTCMNCTWTVTGLKPETTCVFRVRACTAAGSGVYCDIVTTTTTTLSMVESVGVNSVLDASTIQLAWHPVVLQEWEVDHYTIYYTTFSTRTVKAVDQHTTRNTETSQIFYLTHLDPKFEHHFQVTVSIVVDGEEFESPRSTLLIYNFDLSHFQLHLSPVDNCASWEASKARLLEETIHLTLTEVVSELCNCSFSSKFLRTGKFRCWNSPSEVTYRSSTVGVASYNSTQIVDAIESWVRSDEATVDVGQVTLQVLNSTCAVKLASLREGECGRNRNGISPTDPCTVKCG